MAVRCGLLAQHSPQVSENLLPLERALSIMGCFLGKANQCRANFR
jgi:hypothetical protein